MDRNEIVVAGAVLVMLGYYFISKKQEPKIEMDEGDFRDFSRIREAQHNIVEELKKNLSGIDLDTSVYERKFPKGSRIIQVARRLKKALELLDTELLTLSVSAYEQKGFTSLSDETPVWWLH